MLKFKKGDRVAVIGSWDSKGTAYIRRATVHSCGKKVMRLIDANTGELFGREIAGNDHRQDYVSHKVILDCTDTELENLAIGMGQAVVAYERTHTAQSLTHHAERGHSSPGYVDTMHRHYDSYHEPRVLWWEGKYGTR